MTTRRWSACLLLGLALIAAGCGSTAQSATRGRDLSIDQSAGGVDNATAHGDATVANAAGGASRSATGGAGTSGRATANGAAPRQSATSATGPIQLGVIYAVNDGAQSAGIDNGNTFSLKDAVRAFVTSYNASGGIGGRRIDPIYEELHSASNDYEAQAQNACSTFTEDNHVAAVINNVGYYSPNLLNCLAKASIPIISGDWAAPDRDDANRYPLFITPTTLLGEARVAAVVAHLADSGFLKANSKIGVIIEDCPVNQRVYANGLVPALKRRGLKVTASFSPRCFQSLQDVGSQAADLGNAALQFRQKLVDRVIFVSQGAEANMVFLFSQAADAQQYFPSYALSSVSAATVLALNAAASQMVNMHGVGWLPSLDTADPQQSLPTSTGKKCLERMKAQGVQPASNADYTGVYGACDSFNLYDLLLQATHGVATPSAITQALAAIGPSYVSASTLDGRMTMAGGRLSAAAGRLFAFIDGRFQYTGATFTL